MIDAVYKELKLVKPILAILMIGISCLFIADRYDSKCGCGGECECACVTKCEMECKCNLTQCEGGWGHEVIPTETM